jgi:hypothetical protein
MTADELLGFSKEAVEPIEVELKDGLTVKIVPLGLSETLKIQSDIDTNSPEGMAEYLAHTISVSIVEPDLNEQQRNSLKTDIISWPSNIINKIMSSYYDGLGISDEDLSKSIDGAANFLEESQQV